MSDQYLREQLVWACRILGMQGHGDYTLGHVSVRDGDTVIMKRNGIGLEEVTDDALLTIDLDGNRLAGNGPVHLESVLHTSVYRARPDVHAVVHTHPLYSTAFGATDAKLEMINHDAVLFYDGLAYFDKTAELIMTPEQGESVAAALGQKRVVIMRGHGVLVTGKTLPWVVYTALTLERVLQIQSIARSFGELTPMSDEMASTVYQDKYRDEFIGNYWNYLIREVERAGYAPDDERARRPSATKDAEGAGHAPDDDERHGGPLLRMMWRRARGTRRTTRGHGGPLLRMTGRSGRCARQFGRWSDACADRNPRAPFGFGRVRVAAAVWR
ncbi:MAG: class II aldolase/adducin family protein [Thermomicrobiales bacterium]